MFMRIGLATAVATLVLAACGGSGDGSSGSGSGTSTTSVKVVGDSLSDSGTFGIKFTVQGAPAHAIWTERVATALSAPALCPRYRTPGPALNPAATACTSHAVGGARINPRTVPADSTPLSIPQQLKDLRAAGAFNPGDLLLVDGGGNDLADLASDYLDAVYVGGAGFNALTSELLTPAELGGLTLVQVGQAYAVKLAQSLADALTAQALDRGAQRVVVLTAPDVTRTPKFVAVLVRLETILNLAGGNGSKAAADVKGAAHLWTVAFNNAIKTHFAGDSRVLVVDFYAELNKWLDTPAAYGLTNTSTPVCPATGVDGFGVPTYSIATCTDALLSATAPGGDWWKTYVFSDNFHGTPRTNELMADAVVKAIEAKGWK